MSIRINKSIWYWFITIICAYVNVAFLNNMTVSYIFVAAECVFLFVKVLQGNWAKYLSYYIIFISLSVEFSRQGTDTFYSLKNIRIFGLNLGIWLLIPIFLAWVVHCTGKNRKESRLSYYREYSKKLILINILAAFVGLFGLLLNENGILSVPGYFNGYIDNAYSFMFMPFAMIAGFSLIFYKQPDEIYEIENGIKFSLIGAVFEILFSYAFDFKAIYGGNVTLLSSSVLIFSMFLILIGSYKEYELSSSCIIIGVIGTLVQVLYKASGKLFIQILLVVIIIVMKNLKEKNTFYKIGAIIIAMIGIIAIPMVPSFLSSLDSSLINYKIFQVEQVLDVRKWNLTYLMQMENSPRVRFGEFLNVVLEYIHKPWFILTGKGYGGSVSDISGLLFLTPSYLRGDGFTNVEYTYNVFYNLHEFTTILITFGGLGLKYIVDLLKLVRKNIAINPWIVIGVFWFVIYYGYSFTLTAFGTSVLLYGIIECDKNRSDYESTSIRNNSEL